MILFSKVRILQIKAIAVVALWVCISCGSATEEALPVKPDKDNVTGENNKEGEDGQKNQLSSQDQMIDILTKQSFKEWLKEPSVHSAGSTSPHSRARTYFNDTLVESINAGNKEHKVGSISLKELYDATDQLKGYAAAIKIKEGSEKDSWYWYEVFSTSKFDDPDFEGVGLALCANCHGSSAVSQDFVTTSLPEKIE